MDYQDLVRREATAVGLDPHIAVATMLHESAGNPSALSKAGAVGLMQVMPTTAPGVDLNDPEQNVRFGVRYLKAQIDKFGVAGGLAAYNAGPGRVGKTADFADLPAETRAYVPKIMNHAAQLSESSTPTAAGPTLEQHYAALEKAKAAGDEPAVAEITQNIVATHQRALQKAQAAGDEPAVQEIQGALSQFQDAPATQASPQAEKAPVEAPEAPADYAKLGRTIHKAYNGEDFQGSDEEASDWAKQFASDAGWNTGTLAKVALNADKWTPEEKQAFLELDKSYDKEDSFSGDTLKRVGKSILTDPLTYLTLGSGKVIAKGGQAATSAAVRNALEKSLAKRVITSTAGKGAIEGAAIGAGQNALQQQGMVNVGGQDSIDLGETAAVAALGGGLGAGVGKLADKLSGISAVKALAKNAGSEEGARIDSEIVSRLDEISQNPNFRDQAVRSEQLNGVAGSFIKEAQEGIKTIGAADIAAQGGNAKLMRSALQNWKSLSLPEINALRGNSLGDAVADSVVKAQRTRSLTAEQEATGGLRKLGRSVLDILPIPAPVRYGAKAVMGGQVSRKATTEELLKTSNVKAAQRITRDLGPSAASTAGSTIESLAQQATTRQAAAQTASDAAKTQARADAATTRAQAQADAATAKAQAQADAATAKAKAQADAQAKRDADKAAKEQAKATAAADKVKAMADAATAKAKAMADAADRKAQEKLAKEQAAAATAAAKTQARADAAVAKAQAKAQAKADAQAAKAKLKADADAAQAQAKAAADAAQKATMDEFAATGKLPEGLHTNSGQFQATLKHYDISSDDLVKHLRGLAKDAQHHKDVSEFLTPGMNSDSLYRIQNGLTDAGVAKKEVSKGTLAEGALSEVRDPAKYEVGMKKRMMDYDKVEASIERPGALESRRERTAAKEVLAVLKNGKPSDPEVLKKATAILNSINAHGKQRVEDLLAPVLAFYRKQ